jgi:hypothetical protein
MKKLTIILSFITIAFLSSAQTTVISDVSHPGDASAVLDIYSTSKGLLVPRVTSTGDVSSPATGLLVFQTGGTAGYYYNSGTSGTPNWVRLDAGMAPSGTLGVDKGGTGATSFTANRILFGNGTSALSTSSSLIWDNSNSRLGIGGTPSYKLQVNDATNSATINRTIWAQASQSTTGNRAITAYTTNPGDGTTTNYAVYSESDGTTSEQNVGTYGAASGSSNENFGIYGNTVGTGTYNFGVVGKSTGTPTGTKYNYGINGYASGATGSGSYNIGVNGESAGTGTYNIGVSGKSQTNNTTNYGMWGGAYGGTGATNVAVKGWAAGGSVSNRAFEATASGTSAYSFYGISGDLHNVDDISTDGDITENSYDVSRWRGVLASAPTADLQDGDIYFNTTDSKVYIRANSSWVALN